MSDTTDEERNELQALRDARLDRCFEQLEQHYEAKRREEAELRARLERCEREIADLKRRLEGISPPK